MRLRGIIVSATAASFLLSSSASALSFGVKVQAGLDPATRALLQQLPIELHDQIIATLTDAQPIALATIDATFDRLDQSIDHTLSAVQCTADGVPIIAGQAAASMRAGFFSHSSAMSGDTAATDMDAFAKAQRAKIGRETNPSDVGLLYDNIILTADNTNCHFQHAPAGTLADLRKHEIVYFHGQEDWQFLDTLNCVNPRACYGVAYQDLQTLIRSADRRDVQATSAVTVQASLPKPNGSKANGYTHQQPGFMGYFSDTFDVGDYEIQVHKILSIELSIVAANIQRTASALVVLDGEEAKLGTLQATLTAMHKTYGSSSIPNIQAEIGGAAGSDSITPNAGVAQLIADIAALKPDDALNTSNAAVVIQDVATVTADRQTLTDDATSLERNLASRIATLRAQQTKKADPVFHHPTGWHQFA